MTLQDIGSIGELVGAIATIATLAYLAVQVRQNSEQLREATKIAKVSAFDRTVESFSRYRNFLTVPENAELYSRGLLSYQSLTDAEKVRFRAIIEEYFFAYSAMYTRSRSDLYLEGTWNTQAAVASSILNQQGVSEWWADRKKIFDDQFRQEMERRRDVA